MNRLHSSPLSNRLLKNFLKGSKGSSMVIYALSLTMLIGFTSLVVDVGMFVVEKTKLTSAVDAATLAAAQSIIRDPGQEYASARSIMDKNGFREVPIVVQLEDEGMSVRVTSNKDVHFMLARVIGFTKANVQATAKGKVLPINRVNNGIRPFAIEDQELELYSEYTLKNGAGDGTTGNFGAVGIDGTGAAIYLDTILNGSENDVAIGDLIPTQTGNISGKTAVGVETLINGCTHYLPCTPEHFDPDCPRVVTIVVVDTLDVTGHSYITVVGFASFFLESVEGMGKDSILTGQFVGNIVSGSVSDDVNQSNYGLFGVRLTE